MADSPLREMDNVILTPHLAAYSLQAIEDLRAAVTVTVSDVIQGYWPRHVMNAGVTPRRELRRRLGERAAKKKEWVALACKWQHQDVAGADPREGCIRDEPTIR